FGAGDRGNGYVLAPSVRYAWNTSARSKWDLGIREQLFFGIGADPNPLAPQGAPGGLLDEAHAALLGYTWAVATWANLTVRGGPDWLWDRGGSGLEVHPRPAARGGGDARRAGQRRDRGAAGGSGRGAAPADLGEGAVLIFSRASRGRGRGWEGGTDGSNVHDRRAVGRGEAALELGGAGSGGGDGAGGAGDRPAAQRVQGPRAGDGGAVHAAPGPGGAGDQRPGPGDEDQVGA